MPNPIVAHYMKLIWCLNFRKQGTNMKYTDAVVCPICSKLLNRFNSLRKHIMKVHPNYIKFLQENLHEKRSEEGALSYVLKKIKVGDLENILLSEYKKATADNEKPDITSYLSFGEKGK